MAHMDAVWADEFLREHSANLTPNGIFKLTRLATGSEEMAQDALSHRLMEDLRKE